MRIATVALDAERGRTCSTCKAGDPPQAQGASVPSALGYRNALVCRVNDLSLTRDADRCEGSRTRRLQFEHGSLAFAWPEAGAAHAASVGQDPPYGSVDGPRPAPNPCRAGNCFGIKNGRAWARAAAGTLVGNLRVALGIGPSGPRMTRTRARVGVARLPEQPASRARGALQTQGGPWPTAAKGEVKPESAHLRSAAVASPP